MLISNFRSLSGDLQRSVVQQKGVFLFGRTAVGAFVKLYQVESFYVEIFFDQKRSAVIQIISFDDPTKLQPYLRQVDVRVIYELLG